MAFENEEGLPWTASIHARWIVLIVALSSGTALIALGIYLSLWIRSKGRSLAPLIAFSLTALCALLDVAIIHWEPRSQWGDYLGMIDSLLFLVAPFLLRHEIQVHFRETEGWEPNISPFFTFLLSALYINYRLNPISLAQENPLTTLNLSNPTNSAKID
jgi:hypothetical protein